MRKCSNKSFCLGFIAEAVQGFSRPFRLQLGALQDDIREQLGAMLITEGINDLYGTNFTQTNRISAFCALQRFYGNW
jgi:hypothetical protein